MKIGSPPMTSFSSNPKWWHCLVVVCPLLLVFENCAFAFNLEIPSRPNTFPLQVDVPLEPLHPVIWGATNFGLADVSQNMTNLVQVASSPSSSHNVGLLRDGMVIAWGKTNNGRCQVPVDLKEVVQVAAGGSHSMALKSDGTIVAWGSRIYGQTEVPDNLDPAVQVAAGAFHSLALLADGTVSAWGDDSYGQCDTPVDLTNVVQISAGHYFNIALKNDGKVSTWGSDLSDPPVAFTNPAGLGDVVQVAAGGSHALALLKDKTVTAWGDNSAGQCDVPGGLTNVIQVAAGSYHSLALLEDGSVVSWGLNGNGQSLVPSRITNAIQISAGSVHSLALATRDVQLLSIPELPSYVNLSNTPSLTLSSPVSFFTTTDSRGNPTNVSTGLPVELSLASGPATLTDKTLSFQGEGTVVLSSYQAGNGRFLPATLNSAIILTRPKSQAIEFELPSQFSFSYQPITLNAKATSGLDPAYSVADPSVALISNGLLVMQGVGTTTITAFQMGNYTDSLRGDVSQRWIQAPSVERSLVVTKGSQTITSFESFGTQPVGSSKPLTNLPSASSRLPVTVSVKSGAGIFTNGILSIFGEGTIVLSANQSGDHRFFPAQEVTVNVPAVSALPQSISFPEFASIPFSTNRIRLVAVAESGLPVGYTSSETNIALVYGQELLLSGVGTTSITAYQAGNFNGSVSDSNTIYWRAATPVTRTLVVSKGVQEVTPFPPLGPLASGSRFNLGSLTNMSSSSGLFVSYRVISGDAYLEGDDLVLGQVGTVILGASQGGSFLYNPAQEVTTVLKVLKNQSLSPFPVFKDLVYKPRLKIGVKSPSSSSKLPVSVTLVSGPGYIASGTNVFAGTGSLTVTGGGTFTLFATQPGNSNYAAAPPVYTRIVVKPASQTIGKITLKKMVFGNSPITIPTPLASSGRPVSVYLPSNSLAIADLVQGSNSSVLTIKGAGTVTVMSSQSGDNSYLPVTNSVSFVVTKAPQTITAFPKISNVSLSAKSLRISSLPVASSGLPVVVAVKSGPTALGPLTNGVVTFTGTGKITLTADQPGDQNYLPAKQVITTITVY